MPIVSENNLNNTSVLFLHQTSIKSQIIYIVTLLSVLGCLLALPFIYTPISIKSIGIMQSNIERAELLAPANGRLVLVNLKDNQKIIKGTTLLTIDATLPNREGGLLNSFHNQLLQQLKDANSLLTIINSKGSDIALQTENPKLQTNLYAASWQQYLGQLQNMTNAKERALSVYHRYQILYNKRVVAQTEYEQYQFNYQQALSDLEMVTKKHKTQWQTELNQYRNELRNLQKQQAQLDEQKKQYTLKATVTGTIQNLTGLQVGSLVYANQKLGEISPDSALIAFCFVKPADIGLIKKGQRVRFQIDAYNYHQWGFLTGFVVDIADDITIKDQDSYFKIKCQLNKSYLQLKNGYKGRVKKGMTFNARFNITKRSLYQLLYDKVDDWLNPNEGLKTR